jgi:hypothetical protein
MAMKSLTLSCALALAPWCAVAQQPAIPTVDLPEASVRTAQSLGAVLGLRQTADGKVLVNDALRRQMLLFDTTLSNRIVVMDSTPGTSSSYGPLPVPLIPFLGDSSLFVDSNSRTVVVLDGHGHVARTVALPRPQDVVLLIGAQSGFDARGRLVVQGPRVRTGPPDMRMTMPSLDVADSLLLLRVDFDTRRVDTISRVARPAMKLTTQKTRGGAVYTVIARDPLRPVDDWSVLANGSIAIVRGHDYHIDLIAADGTVRSGPKIPFDWKRLSEDDKRRLDDSLRVAQDSLLATGYPTAQTVMRSGGPCESPNGGRGDPGDPGGGGRGGGRSGGAGGPPPPAGGGGCLQVLSAIAPLVGPSLIAYESMPPLAELWRATPIADYADPFRMNATMADADGNLWILPRVSTLSKRGELVYDVVNAKGELFERVRFPAGRAIAGFAKGGVVYLTSGDMKSGYILERTRLP